MINPEREKDKFYLQQHLVRIIYMYFAGNQADAGGVAGCAVPLRWTMCEAKMISRKYHTSMKPGSSLIHMGGFCLRFHSFDIARAQRTRGEGCGAEHRSCDVATKFAPCESG